MKSNIKAFFKWLLIAVFLGIVIGLLSVLFHYSIDIATEIRQERPYLLYLLPLGGVFIVFLYKLFKAEGHKGTDFVIASVRENDTVTPETSVLIFLSTVVTHLFGGSSGREGAALQLGSSVADMIGKKLNLDKKDISLITICGMATAFATLFGTPITAVIFSMEVVSVGIMHYSALFPCVVASATGCMLASHFGVKPTSFPLTGVPSMTPDNLLRVAVLAIFGAALSILFCLAMHKASHFYKDKFKNPYIRIIAGAVFVIILTFIVGNRDYNGAGMDMINLAFTGKVVWYAFILKIIFTALTLGAGFKGGEIVPAFFTGATFGNIAAPILGLSPSFGAGVGLISVFCGVTNCPVASIMLSIELFGSEGLIFFALSCGVGYLLSGYTGLYSEQKILYSKTKAEFIDRKTE